MSEVTLPKVALELVNYFTGMRTPVPNAQIEEMNKTPPDNGWGKDGYDTLTLDPNGKVFDKVI